MAFRDTVRRRLEILIERIKGQVIDFPADPLFTVPPIHFDVTFLQTTFLTHVNGIPFGFDDILEKKLVKSDVPKSVRLNGVVAKLLEKSPVKNNGAYAERRRDHSGRRLRLRVAELAGVSGETVLLTDLLSTHLSSPQDLERLRTGLTEDLRKYLLGDLATGEFTGTLTTIRDTIVDIHMLA
jgi:hypothetical protein